MKQWRKITQRLVTAWLSLFPPALKSRDWHKVDRPFFPVRLIDGTLCDTITGQLWRRWNGERWEYQQDDETEDEFNNRAW